MDSKKAFRSGSQQLYLPPEELDDAPQEQVDIDDEQSRENATYASLNGHPGWELIKKNFNETIARYRSGQTIKTAIGAGKTNSEVGELTRTSNAVADELEAIVLTVETAAAALEEEAKEDGQRRPKQKDIRGGSK